MSTPARPSSNAGTLHGPVVVLGATGGVGAGVVAALRGRGHGVIAVARDGERLRTLADNEPGIATLEGSVASDAEAAALTQALRAQVRPPAAVVVALKGEFVRGRLLDQPPAFLDDQLRVHLIPQLHAARHLIPLLAADDRGGRYLVIGGPFADIAWLGYGHISVGEAALRMLVHVLRQEAASTAVRVQQLAVASPVRTERNAACACPEWPQALAVGQRAVELLEDASSTDTLVRFDPLGTTRRLRSPLPNIELST